MHRSAQRETRTAKVAATHTHPLKHPDSPSTHTTHPLSIGTGMHRPWFWSPLQVAVQVQVAVALAVTLAVALAVAVEVAVAVALAPCRLRLLRRLLRLLRRLLRLLRHLLRRKRRLAVAAVFAWRSAART